MRGRQQFYTTARGMSRENQGVLDDIDSENRPPAMDILTLTLTGRTAIFHGLNPVDVRL